MWWAFQSHSLYGHSKLFQDNARYSASMQIKNTIYLLLKIVKYRYNLERCRSTISDHGGEVGVSVTCRFMSLYKFIHSSTGVSLVSVATVALTFTGSYRYRQHQLMSSSKQLNNNKDTLHWHCYTPGLFPDSLSHLFKSGKRKTILFSALRLHIKVNKCPPTVFIEIYSTTDTAD